MESTGQPAKGLEKLHTDMALNYIRAVCGEEFDGVELSGYGASAFEAFKHAFSQLPVGFYYSFCSSWHAAEWAMSHATPALVTASVCAATALFDAKAADEWSKGRWDGRVLKLRPRFWTRHAETVEYRAESVPSAEEIAAEASRECWSSLWRTWTLATSRYAGPAKKAV